jgi:signal transduction histidine kinase
MGKVSQFLSKIWISKFVILVLLITSYKVLENFKFEAIDHFVRDSLQFLNRTSEVDSSFVTLNININTDGISVPHTFEGIKKVIDRVQCYEPKNIVIMMEPLDFSQDPLEKKKIFQYLQSQQNLFLNKYEARNAIASFGKDELFKNFKRFIHFYKCSDSSKERENRRALISLSSFGEVELFDDLRQLGYTPKSETDFKYSFEYWNSKQIFLKSYPLGTFGNYQTSNLFDETFDGSLVKNKTVIIGTNDEFSHLVSKSPFSLFGMKTEMDYQKNWIPLQDVLANNFSHLTTGTYIKFLRDIDDLFIVLLLLYVIILIPIKFEKKLYLMLSLIPTIVVIEVVLYLIGNYYINFSRSLVILVLGQYFILPLILLWKFKKQEEEKYNELNKMRVDALIEVAEHVAHDLRSPLSTVNLVTYKATFENAEHREILKSALTRIDQIIGEILNSARSNDSASKSLVDVFEVSDPLISELKSKYSNIEFHSSIRKNVCILHSDNLKLSRILSNIFQNSIEALTDSEITNPKITLDFEFRSQNLLIKISDNGPGIRPEILKLLGTKQITAKVKSKGYGIGILQSKKLIEELGGKFTISSEIGRGTEFVLCFANQ